jgi:hypothetical protein
MGKKSPFLTWQPIHQDCHSQTGVVVLTNSCNDINDISLHILESKFTLPALNKIVQL